jgi:hypothetical protein
MTRLNLGQLIDHFVPKTNAYLVLQRVYFEFADAIPRQVMSYRGYYEDLAITYEVGGRWPEMSSADFYTMLKRADGDVFTGYKGGEFEMSRDSRVWVSSSGMASKTVVVGVRFQSEHAAYLQTAFLDE